MNNSSLVERWTQGLGEVYNLHGGYNRMGTLEWGDRCVNDIAFDADLDVRQLACPLPILRAKKSLAFLSSGQVLKVVATDKKAPDDFVDFCAKTGNELLSSTERGGEFIFLIRRR